MLFAELHPRCASEPVLSSSLGFSFVQVPSRYVRQTASMSGAFYRWPLINLQVISVITKIIGVGDWTRKVQNCRMHYQHSRSACYLEDLPPKPRWVVVPHHNVLLIGAS